MSPFFHRSHPFVLVYPFSTLIIGGFISLGLLVFHNNIITLPGELIIMLAIAFLSFVVMFFGLQMTSYYLTGLKIEGTEIAIIRFRAPFEYSVEKINHDHISSVTSRKKTPLENIFDMGELEFATTDGRIIILPYMPSPLSLAENCHQISSLNMKG